MADLLIKSDAFVFPTIAAGAALVVYTIFGAEVSVAREKYGVKAPNTTGKYFLSFFIAYLV